jgi:hypothetical protein
MTPPLLKKNQRIAYVLKTGEHADLNNHVFNTQEEAADWLRQPYVANAGFRVCRAIVARKLCCGQERIVKLLEQVSP